MCDDVRTCSCRSGQVAQALTSALYTGEGCSSVFSSKAPQTARVHIFCRRTFQQREPDTQCDQAFFSLLLALCHSPPNRPTSAFRKKRHDGVRVGVERPNARRPESRPRRDGAAGGGGGLAIQAQTGRRCGVWRSVDRRSGTPRWWWLSEVAK